MMNCLLRYSILIFVLILNVQLFASTQPDVSGKQMLVTMRMIGDEFLKSIGDTKSKILPSKVKDGYYKIAFETEVAVLPESLVKTIDLVMKRRSVDNGYIVEVQKCYTGENIHSYEMRPTSEGPGAINCGTRPIENGCYNLFITIVKETVIEPERLNRGGNHDNDLLLKVLLLLGAIPIIGWLWKFYRIKNKTVPPHKVDNSIKIGAYKFDEVTLELSHKTEKAELSGKEADLLMLLHKNRNTVIEREKLLSEVWADEGDYVGRTLDVYISKLRKRLDGDPSLKIVNIRGVGYKLIVNENAA